MKTIRTFFLVLFLSVCSLTTLSQVGVNTDGSQPNSAAILDVKSTSKGFLPPRMTSVQRNAIVSPPSGLMVFCTDCGTNGTGVLCVYSDGRWRNYFSSDCTPPSAPEETIHTPYSNQIIWNWKSVVGALGYKWNTTPDTTTAITITENTSYTETGLACNTQYNRYVWAYNTCGYSIPTTLTETTLNAPPAPERDVNTVYPTEIIWKWMSVPGATGYKWSRTDNYESAENVGANTSRTESGLSCGIEYERYVWAYNTCGNSTSQALTQVITTDPDPPTEGTHVPYPSQIRWEWNEVSGATGYKWSRTNNIATALDMGTGLYCIEVNLVCDNLYRRFVWAYNDCGLSASTSISETTSTGPYPPEPSTHSVTRTDITWKWNTSIGAIGYKWNTTNNLQTAIDLGPDTTYYESGFACGTYYTRYIWAYSDCGVSAVKTISQRTSLCPITCGSNFVDSRDGKTYGSIQIGTQCWMKQSVNAGIMINGTLEQTDNGVLEKYCYNDDSTTNCSVYGGLYQWAEAVQYINGTTNSTQWDPAPTGPVQGVCPEGWHIPTDAEWTTLINYLGGTASAGGKMKETGYTHWVSPNSGASNSSGFTALGAGYRYYNGTFTTQKYLVYFIAAIESSNEGEWTRYLSYNSGSATRDSHYKPDGLSVRCIND